MVYDFIFGWRAREREPRLRCFNLSKNNSVVASFVIFPRRTRGNAFSGMMKREINWKGNGQGGRKWTEEERRQNCRVPSHGPMTVALLPMSWIPFFSLVSSEMYAHTHTHTQRERERGERYRVVSNETSTCVKRLNERRWERERGGRDGPVMDGMRKNCQVLFLSPVSLSCTTTHNGQTI
jgi:hypothetical protein